jgi:hypothetical protein
MKFLELNIVALFRSASCNSFGDIYYLLLHLNHLFAAFLHLTMMYLWIWWFTDGIDEVNILVSISWEADGGRCEPTSHAMMKVVK